MSQSSRIQDLVHAKLTGRKIDVVGFVDELLDAANKFNETRCCLATDQSLRFELGDQVCDIELDAARAKLRMLCARLAVLCGETAAGPVSPYGASGTIACPGRPSYRWAVRFKNTPGEQEFAIALVADRHPVTCQQTNQATT
jgi:hypothetical protein